MTNLGREDAALIFLARSRDFPRELLEESMQAMLPDIQRNHEFGCINRIFGPLNAEWNPPRSNISEGAGDEQNSTWLKANFPMLALRNDAMLEEALKYSGFDEVQLRQVIQTAKKIKMVREGGDPQRVR
jgi:hypothetical protein